jgi:SAM-dependent methyltransferase
LEIGPNKFPSTYQEIVDNDTITWETLDIFECSNLTYVAANEYEFPIPDETFDIVLSGQVIEHVRKIWIWMKELSRVCKRGGWVITVNPVSWRYHEAPIDCWRIYPEGMKALYDEAGLEATVSECESLEPFVFSTWSFIRALSKSLFGRRRSYQWPVADTISIGMKK